MNYYKMNNDIKVKEIIAPSLNSPDYASSLDEVFNNINYNFITLSNRDFVKGETGDSLDIEEVTLNKNNELYNVLVESLKTHVEKTSSKDNALSDLEEDGTKISGVFDIIDNTDNPLKIYMIKGRNEDIENSEYKYVSSLPFVFLDGRFNRSGVGDIDDLAKYNFELIENASCIMIYDHNENSGKGGFKVLENAFPKLYMDSKLNSFCWKINGVETGISATGLQGKSGDPLYIAYCSGKLKSENNNCYTCSVDKIYDVEKGLIYEKPISQNDNISFNDIMKYNNTSCLVCIDGEKNKTGEPSEPYQQFGMGILKVVSNKIITPIRPRQTVVNPIIPPVIPPINLIKTFELRCTFNSDSNILDFIKEYIGKFYSTTISDLQSQLTTIDSDLNGEEGIKSQLNNVIQKVKDNYSSLDSNISDLVNIINELTERISVLESYHLPPTEPENPTEPIE